MKMYNVLMGIAFLVLSPFLIQAQLLDPVDYHITEMPDTVKAGEIFTVTVTAVIEDNWHLYSIHNNPDDGPYPTRLRSGNSDLAVAGDVSESTAEIVIDPNFDAELGWHSNRADFTVPVAFHHELQGSQTVQIDIFYQACDDKSCLPPKTKTVTQDIFLSGVASDPFVFNRVTGDDDQIKIPAAYRTIFWMIGALIVMLIVLKLLQLRGRKKN